MRDTLGGHVDVAIGPPGIWLPHVESGDARFLLLINEDHVDREGLSGLPIPSDFGIDYEMIHQIQGIFTETGTPPEVNPEDRRGVPRGHGNGPLQGVYRAELACRARLQQRCGGKHEAVP